MSEDQTRLRNLVVLSSPKNVAGFPPGSSLRCATIGECRLPLRGQVTECTCRSAGTAVDEGFVASESEVSQTFFSQYCGNLSNKLTNVRLASKPSLFTTTRHWACIKH